MEMVEVIDLVTNKITKIPRSELATGMVQVRIEGQKNILWQIVSNLRVTIFVIHRFLVS